MNLTLKQLEDLACEIVEHNEMNVMISGSLALHILGVKLRRDPSDIDIYCPYDVKFNPTPEMKRYTYETEEDYENVYYERTAYKIGETKIDVFTPVDKEGDVLLTDENSSWCLAKHVIIGFKVQHALGESYNRCKHKDDVTHILINN